MNYNLSQEEKILARILAEYVRTQTRFSAQFGGQPIALEQTIQDIERIMSNIKDDSHWYGAVDDAPSEIFTESRLTDQDCEDIIKSWKTYPI